MPYWCKVGVVAMFVVLMICGFVFLLVTFAAWIVDHLGVEVFLLVPIGIGVVVLSVFAADVFLRTRPIARLFGVKLQDE